MFSTSALFQEYLSREYAPTVIVFLTTASGLYVYSQSFPDDAQIGTPVEYLLFDGTMFFDGSKFFGGASNLSQIIDRGARLEEYDSDLEETIAPQSGKLVGNIAISERTEFGVALTNVDLHFSEILAADTFLAATMQIRFGFRGLPYDAFATIFTGTVTQAKLSRRVLSLVAIK